MRMYDIIMKKRNGFPLTKEEIYYFVDGFTNGTIPDYQASALLMAIYFQHMNYEETLNLTMAMADSGEHLDLSGISGIKADKHSTGGVGDKTTLVLAPMVAAVGVKTAKMSGRGLGHTGGTIDKLESFPGFSTTLSQEQFVKNVNDIGLAVTGQTGNITPADKKIYALRDVTGTVDNISLIASSIMSKKLAAGADVIVLDVKTGNGAFMKNIEDATELAKTLVDIGNGAGKKTYAVISEMNEPLGYAIGNSLEVIEAIDTLKGNGPRDLYNLCIELGSLMVAASDQNISLEQAKQILKKTIEDGSAYRKFKEFIESQGGNPSDVDNCHDLIKVNQVLDIKSFQSGYIAGIQTENIGNAVMMLGGGRQKKGDSIDHSVGVIIKKKVGEQVKEGESLATVYINNTDNLDTALDLIKSSFEFSEDIIKEPELIKGIIS
ncbi:MAG: pyrimidine-nucleoside phosphorylase [Lachnospira sp.]|nr:pyrimidine-nucleoside phosphorylase [Lachnospira sp.]